MKYRLKADLTFEANSDYHAMELLQEHLLFKMEGEDAGYKALEHEGTLSIELAPLTYGEEHARSVAFQGAGDESSVHND